MYKPTDTKTKTRSTANSGEQSRTHRPHAILSRGDYRRIVAELLG